MSMMLLVNRTPKFLITNMVMPIEWLAPSVVDMSVPLEHSLFSPVQVDMLMPVEFLEGVRNDVILPVSYLETTAVDHSVPLEFLETTVDDNIIPYEHLGGVRIFTGSLPVAKIHQAYSFTLTAVPGVPPYTWTILAGSLPDGLSLNSATGEISGTPTELGRFTILIQVEDDNGSTFSKAFNFVVESLPIREIPIVSKGIDNIINEVEFNLVTREVSEKSEIVWSLVTPIELDANEVFTLHARDLHDPPGWLLDAETPSSTDYLLSGDWTYEGNLPGSSEYSDVVYAEGLFVAVGENGQIATSPDGENWTARTSGTTADFLRIEYGNGVFIAMAQQNIRRSDDGITWTNITSNLAGTSIPPTGLMFNIAYGNGRWIIVGTTTAADPAIITSSDNGNSWADATISADTEMYFLRGIVYTGDPVYTWLAGGSGPDILVSGTGTSWTAVQGLAGFPRANSGGVLDMAYDANRNKVITVLGSQGHIFVGSPDPTTWERQETPVEASWVRVNVVDDAVYVSGADHEDYPDRQNVLISTRSYLPGDWAVVDIPYNTNGAPLAVAEGNNILVVVDESGENYKLVLYSLADIELGRDSGPDIPIIITNGGNAATLWQLLLSAKRITIKAEDSVVHQVDTSASVAAHGSKSLSGDIISPDISRARAQLLANLYTTTYQNGLKSVDWSTIEIDEDSLAAMVDREIGDRVHVSVPRREIDEELIVVAIEEEMLQGEIHIARYVGIPAPEVE
jgi:hypothetical protein